jgi:hypothetical protein
MTALYNTQISNSVRLEGWRRNEMVQSFYLIKTRAVS